MVKPPPGSKPWSDPKADLAGNLAWMAERLATAVPPAGRTAFLMLTPRQVEMFTPLAEAAGMTLAEMVDHAAKQFGFAAGQILISR